MIEPARAPKAAGAYLKIGFPSMSTGILDARARRRTCAIVLGTLGIVAIAAGYLAYGLGSGFTDAGTEGVVRQRGSSDCGAAALQMVFAHFNVECDYERLASKLEIGSGGTSMLRLKRVAESEGLRCRGWRLAARDLNSIPLPAILFLRRNHFVVLDALDTGDGLFVRDPARGRLRITRRKLASIWRGEALLFSAPVSGSPGTAFWFEPSLPGAHMPQ